MEKIRLDWMALTLVEADRPGWFQRRHDRSMRPRQGLQIFLIGDNEHSIGQPSPAEIGLVRQMHANAVHQE